MPAALAPALGPAAYPPPFATHLLRPCRCIILSGSQQGQTCNLYSLAPGSSQAAEVAQQGPQTTWVSGYRDPSQQFPVPDVNATAPGECSAFAGRAVHWRAGLQQWAGMFACLGSVANEPWLAYVS